MSLKTKVSIGFLIGIYLFSHSFTQWIFGYGTTVQAAEETQEQIIAVLVDKNVYDKHTDDINRYAQEYLQRQSSATKALVMPLDKNRFQASDLWKVLENLYQEGIKEKKSILVGTILIGDLPLPVIKENNYVYPSIYPYTDIEKPSYVFDSNSTYFIPQENGDHTADIWQSTINFEERDEEYLQFFSKLRTYSSNPTNYASDKIWYDDFIGLKKYFSDQFLSGYVNNFLFHEDITYHRFTNLIVDYFKDGANSSAVSLINNYTANTAMSTDDDYSQLGSVGEEYQSAISKRKSDLNKMAQEANTDLTTVGNDSDRIPTLMIGQSLGSLIQPYTSLFAPEFLTNISTNANAGGRWSDEKVDSHLKKTTLKDNISSQTFLDTNTLLENALYDKFKNDNYALRIPIPMVYEEYDCVAVKQIVGRFENFYFGKSAFDISSTQQISIYPGTRKNIGSRQNLTSYNYTTDSQQEDIEIDYTARSIGSSYGISSRQVESSRGYNTLLVPKDQKFYDERKCRSSQTIDDFVTKYRGGISPLNIDGDTMQLKENNPKMAWNPRFDINIGGPVYDIAGSKMTLTKMNNNLFFLEELNNSMLHRTQQFRLFPWLVCGETVPAGEVNENRNNGYPQKDPSEVEYFSTYNASPKSVHISTNNINNSPRECGENFVYKTIDTLESHTSPTPQEIEGMSPLTQDRPIDSARFVAFRGIGGGAVKILYPNIYNVEVFKKVGTELTLKSPDEISESIKAYLKEKVAAINIQLTNENNNSVNYYNAKSDGFNRLEREDPFATPRNRQYPTLPENFFIDTLTEDTIKSVAQVLYWQNLGWFNKSASTDLLTDLKNNQTSLDINKKIGYVTENYLTKNDAPSAAIVPGYEQKGYELVYINSDGNDIIKNTTVPTIVENINQQKLSSTQPNTSRNAVNAGLEIVEQQRNEKCGIEKNATVPLLKRPSALSCRMKGLKEMTASDIVKINYKNAQGPVLSLDQFKDTATTRTDNISKFGDQRSSLLGNNGANLSEQAQELMNALDSELTIKLNKASVSMDERNDLSLTLSSKNDIGSLSVRISGTGDNCPIIEGRNLCRSEYTFQGNLFSTPRILPITLAGTNVGSSVINVKVCQTTRCVDRQLIVPLVAGALTNVSIVTPTDRIINGSQLPITVLGTDTYGNPVEQTTLTYRLSTSAGKIISNGNNASSLDLQQFDKNQSYFLDTTNLGSINNITLSLDPLNTATGTVAPRTTKSLSLTTGKLTTKYNAQTVSTISLNLPENTNSYFKVQNGVAQLQEASVPRLVLTLTDPDGKPLESSAVVKSSQGLLIPGTANQTTYNVSGQIVDSKEFADQSSFTIKGGVATVLLYPSFRAGTDTLTIEIPGLPLQTIAVTVNSAGAYRVAIESSDSMLPEKQAEGKILVYDRWNNLVTTPTNVTIQTIGDLLINTTATSSITTQNGISPFQIKTGKIGGSHYLYATIAGVGINQQLPDTKTITTLAPQRKSSNLNAMYMLLGGSDWGNRWNYFTEQSNEAENILTSSDKALAVTTMLTHPDRILAAALRISENGQIYDGTNVKLISNNNELTYNLGARGYISLGANSSFSLRQGAESDSASNQTLLYTPAILDSAITSNEVRNNSIYVNGTEVRSLNSSSNAAEIIMSANYDNNRDLIWDVIVQGNRVGTIRLHTQITNTNMHLNDMAGAQQTWLGGSTNSPRGWMIYDRGSSPLSSQTSRVGGIEDSRDSDTNTSWKNTFQAATAFSQGDQVGKATQHGASPFLINLGDPLIARQSTNQKAAGTDHDAGQGKTIFTESDKSISKTVPFDLDRDSQKDLLVIYTDGSIRVLKNSGGKDPYDNLGMLMVIADGIKNVFVGDADGNSYDDIIVQTSDDVLRAYKNDGGTMDVDGRQICLAIPEGDKNVKNAHEMFVQDMDKDGSIDIVTNDTAGNIQLFYGGSSSAGDNYISKNSSNCDADRQARVDGHKKLIKSYGVNLTPGQKIYDNSLLHRKGLVLPPEAEANDDDTDTELANQPQFQSLIKGKDSDFSALNVASIVNSGLPEVIQYSASPISRLPIYETNITTDTIAYMPMHLLDATSPITAYKEYIRKTSGLLQNGEEIQVKITLQAKQATQFTYLDEIKGPWEIRQNDDGSISTWDKGTLPASAIVDWSISNGYAYMVDNLSLQAGQTVTFGYTLKYISPKLVSIALEDTNTDTYTDIKTYSTDSCQKGYRTFVSSQGKDFNESYIDLSTNVATVQKQAEDDVKALLSEVQDKIKAAADTEDPKVTEMPGMDQVLEKRDQGNTLVQNGNLNISLGNGKLTELTDDVQAQIDTAVKGLCEGFKLGNGGASSGPPVPFNMAFLSPGTYNIFGCKLMNDKGLPAFFFPGTIYAGPYTVPFPYGQKGSTDGFYWAAGGVYPSMIRIYVSPTLTMGLGVAICFGPYTVGAKIPSPFRHIAGNCIVLAKNFGNDKNNDPAPAQLTVPSWQYNLAQGGNCDRPTNDPSKPASPFSLSPSGTNTSTPSSSTPPGGSYGGGLIYFDQQPKALSVSMPSVGSETLKGGQSINLQIEGGNVKGLVKCIINKWMDNQIRYIINNLTNLSVNLYLPDLSTLFEGFDNLSLDKLGTLYDETKNQTDQPLSARQDVAKRLFTKEGMSQNSNAVSNPFDALSSLFENVPLVNINTQNINIQVPFIAQEDLTKYESYLGDWLTRNEKILQEWNMAAQDLGGTCGNIKSGFEKNACNEKLQSYIDVSEKSAQVVRALKQNVNTLERYRSFPIELNKWLSVSQRYLTEVTDTISTFTYDLTSRLQINARRFEQYVDAIILLISAVKTWQVLIDFSVNRKTKCGKCKVDNYDFYSCTLSLLCINLPILPIPNFRIPNINIDLSHINLGMDILLPKFNFVPKNVPLPRLPDLPTPPSIDVNFDLNVAIPQIPVLPAPPTLPELPSFIPNIELNLPTLPPAPRIPKIAPQITQTLKVAEFIAKVFCIVKGGFGLVAEKGVKTRIEQMTQRSRSVEPFDSLSITKITPPLKGFDIQIDTYINMQLNFDQVYDLLAEFADQINAQTNSTFDAVVTENIGSISTASNELENTLQNTTDQGNINVQGFSRPKRRDLQYDDTNAGRIDLLKQLAALQQADTSVERQAKLHQIIAFTKTPADTAINEEGINNVREQATSIVSDKKAEINAIQQQILYDYDSFVQSLQTTLVSDDTQTTTLGSSLFTANKTIVDTVKSEPHPTQSYLDLNKKVMDGFANALETKSAEELNMSLLTYNETKNYVNNTRSVVDQGISLLAMNESDSDKSIAEKPLLAATAGGGGHTMGGSTEVGSAQADISQYVKGIFVKNSSGDMVNVVNRDDNIDTISKNQVRTDMNQDGEEDIIMWDAKQIRMKNANPEKTENALAFTRLYRTDTYDSPEDLADDVSRGGRLSVAGSTFKVWDGENAPEGFALKGQTFDSITMQWTNNDTDGYIVQVTDKVFNRADHLIAKNNAKYILVVASGTNLDGLFLYNELQGGQKRVNDLVNNGTILDVQYYEQGDESIGLTLNNLERKRQYLSVAKLSKRNINRNAVLLEKSSPRSHQEVAGMQLAGDNTGPIADVELIRTQNGSIASKGYNLSAVVGNTYMLAIQRKDDSGIEENSVVFSNGNTQTSKGSSSSINNIVYKTDEEAMTISAKDLQGNTSTYTVNLKWEKAEIDIANIDRPTDTTSVIDTNISERLDNGKVIFERERNGIRSVLTGINNTNNSLLSLFPLRLDQQALSGGVFIKNDLLGLYNQNGVRIGTVDKRTAQISIDDAFKATIDIQVVFTSNTPSIIIKEKSTGKGLFSITVRGKTALNTIITNTNKWQQKSLNDGYGQTFSNGVCIADMTNNCQIYIGTQGTIRLPDTYKNDFIARYSYVDNAIMFTFIDRDGNEVATTRFISQPLP